MKLTKSKTREILREELIGTLVKIVDAKNQLNIGIRGVVIDETKNTLTIMTDEVTKGERLTKKIIKDRVKILLVKRGVVIDGKLLLGRPHERIKK